MSVPATGNILAVETVEETSEEVNLSVSLSLPKFSYEFKSEDFMKALGKYIEVSEIKNLGKLKHSNEWQVTLNSLEAKHKLLEVGKFTIRKKKCVVLPSEEGCVAGRVHWLPVDVTEESIANILGNFGKVVVLNKEKISHEPGAPNSLTRFFILSLKEDTKREDIPHFVFINHFEGLVIVKGRNPMCLECREVGHKKRNCKVKRKHKYQSNQQPAPTSTSVAVSAESGDSTVPNDEANASESASAVPKTKKKKKKASRNKRKASNVTKSTQTSGRTTEGGAMGGSQNVIQEVTKTMGVILLEASKLVSAPGPSAVPSSEAVDPNSSNKKKKKKRKKKGNANDKSDLVAAETITEASDSAQQSPKESLDSGIIPDGNPTSEMVSVSNDNPPRQVPCAQVQVNQSEASSDLNTLNTTPSAVNQKKKRKKKEGGPQIPGLAQS